MTVQRLEHLGDALIDLFVSLILFASLPTATEMHLSVRRADLVKTATMCQAAKSLNLTDHAFVDKLISRRTNQPISPGQHANFFEVVSAVVFLDRCHCLDGSHDKDDNQDDGHVGGWTMMELMLSTLVASV